MKKFEGILICTDLDGTLLRRDCTVSKENIEAIEYFKAEGGYFTFVTGRMPYFAHETYRAVSPNAPVGCINGGGIYDYERGVYISQEALPTSVMELVSYIDAQIPGIGIQVNTFERIYFCSENRAMALFRRATKTPNLFRPYQEVDEPIAKIVFCDEREEAIASAEALLNAHPRAAEFGFIHSERYLYEILPQGIHKGKVLAPLAAYLGIDPRHTVAIGDYDNDVGMLRAAGVGVAVANASPAALAAADYVTVSNEEHAIARIITDLETGAISFS